MEEREGAMDRIGRTIWTVWGYLTGTVGRYLRPEVTTEGNQNVNASEGDAESNVKVNEGCIESNTSEEQKQTWNKLEKKTREVSGVRVRVAAVRWEKGNFSTDAQGDDDIKEECSANKDTHASTVWTVGVQQRSSKDVYKKSSTCRTDKETADILFSNNNEVRSTKSDDRVKKGDNPSAYTDENIHTQDLRVAAREGKQEKKDDGCETMAENVKESKKKCVEQELEMQSHCSGSDDGEHIKKDCVEKEVNAEKKEKRTDRQNNQGKTEDGDKSQMTECEVKEHKHVLKAAVDKEVTVKENIMEEASEATPLLHCKEISVYSEEPQQRMVVGNEYKHLKEVLTCVGLKLRESAYGAIGDEQEVPELKLEDAQMQLAEEGEEKECSLWKEHVIGQVESVEVYEKSPEPTTQIGMDAAFVEDSASYDGSDSLMTLAEQEALEQPKEDLEASIVSEVVRKTEAVQFNNTADLTIIKRSETEQDLNLVTDLHIETGSGNHFETQETTATFHHTLAAEVAAEDVRQLAEEERSQHHQLGDIEELDLQETEAQSLLVQGSAQEKIFDGQVNKLSIMKTPSSEMLTEQVDSDKIPPDEMADSALELHKADCSVQKKSLSVHKATGKTKNSSTEQNVEVLGTQMEVTAMDKYANTELKCEEAESVSDTLKTGSEMLLSTTQTISVILSQSVEAESPISEAQTPFNDQLSQDEYVVQDRSVDTSHSFGLRDGLSGTSHLAESVSALDMQGDLQSSQETEIELHKEREVMPSLIGAEKEISGLLKEAMSTHDALLDKSETAEIRMWEINEKSKDLMDNFVEELKTDFAAADEIKSEEMERSFEPNLRAREEMVLSESMDQCFPEKEDEQKTPVADEELELGKAESSEMLRKETERESFRKDTNTLPSPSAKSLDKTDSTIERSAVLANMPNMDTVTSSTKQTVDLLQTNSNVTVKDTHSSSGEQCEQGEPSKRESESSQSVMDTISETLNQSVKMESEVLSDTSETQNKFEDQLCCEEHVVQDTSIKKLNLHVSSDLPLNETTLEMLGNSQCNNEKPPSSHDQEAGLIEEIKGATSLLYVEEGLSELPKESETSPTEVSGETRILIPLVENKDTHSSSGEQCKQGEPSKREIESSQSVMNTISETLNQSVKMESEVLSDTSETQNKFEDQLCCEEHVVQDTSIKKLNLHVSSDLPLNETTLEMLGNSQCNNEKPPSSHDQEAGLIEEIKGATSLLYVEEGLSELPKESETSPTEVSGETTAPAVEEESKGLEISERLVVHVNLDVLDNIEGGKRLFEEEVMDIENEANEKIESWGKMPEFAANCTEKTLAEGEKDGTILGTRDTTGIIQGSAEKVGEEVISVDNTETLEKRRLGQKRKFAKAARDERDAPSASKGQAATDLILLQTSSLDFTVQKAKIAVKNPLVRPPKDPRTLINMPSVEPLTSPRPLRPSPLPKGQGQGPSIPTKVIGFKLPGLDAGVPVLRKTEAVRKIKEEGVTPSEMSQTPGVRTDTTKHEHTPEKPKWTPPRHPGMVNPMMMNELKSKLKKTSKE